MPRGSRRPPQARVREMSFWTLSRARARSNEPTDACALLFLLITSSPPPAPPPSTLSPPTASPGTLVLELLPQILQRSSIIQAPNHRQPPTAIAGCTAHV